jgi:23S rRNA (cytosine1962-C5)-methyltransferase
MEPGLLSDGGHAVRLSGGSGRILSGPRADVDAYLLDSGDYLLFAHLKVETPDGDETFLRDLAEKQLPGAVSAIARAVKTPQRSEPLAPVWLKGPGGALVAMEGGLRYVLSTDDVLNPGLFLDQRDNRSRLVELVADAAARGPLGQDDGMLNLFSYTGSFSVAAFSAGAPGTTSVDVSARYLRWERQNHEANFGERSAPRLIKDDARDFVRRARKKGARYRFVVIDPPTFSRGQGKPFRARDELVPLVRAAIECFPPHGSAAVLASTNDAGFDGVEFRRELEAEAEDHGLRFEPGRVPEDFRDTHAKSAWLVRPFAAA